MPKVEEWKKMTAEYKKNTIPLGRFDFPQSAQPGVNSQFANMAAASGSNNAAFQGRDMHASQPSVSSLPVPTPPPKDDLYGQLGGPLGAAGAMQPFDSDAIDPLTQLPPACLPENLCQQASSRQLPSTRSTTNKAITGSASRPLTLPGLLQPHLPTHLPRLMARNVI